MQYNARNSAAISLLSLLLTTCSPDATQPTASADIVFIGEHIISMDGSDIGAVAVIGDRIAATGTAEQLRAMIGPTTRVVELGEQALLPGFIDAHGHFSLLARSLDLLDLSSPPIGSVSKIDDIVTLIQQRISESQLPAGEWLVGFGYDDSLLEEQRHPDRDDLDRASTTHPIVIRHVSGHLLVANSAALAIANITSTTPDPEGGIMRRRPGSNEPNGVMEETAMGSVPVRLAASSAEHDRELRDRALSIYSSYGITTIQDSNVGLPYVELMREEAALEEFPVDIVTYVTGNNLDDSQIASVTADTNYVNGFRVGGVKFTLDGSPQGRTAWTTQPYTEGPPGADSSYVAYPSYNPELFKPRIAVLLQRGVPVLAHVNGDAAIDLLITGVADAFASALVSDHRTVAIHAQLMRADQLDRVKELGIVPSFFSAHPFFWGDWHRLSFGEERAAFISPVAAAAALGIPFTIHNDSPVVPPDIMRLVSITVNRATRSGFILGPEQRATVMQALHAVTLGAAYQYFEENEKGSITTGKRADLVILQENPVTADPLRLQDIAIVETISRGRTVYSR